jgi:hypothetical protein
MEVNGYIIEQSRKSAGIPREALGAICAPADLEWIEMKNEGILEVRTIMFFLTRFFAQNSLY